MAFVYMIIIEAVIIVVVVVVIISRGDCWWLGKDDVMALCGALVLRSRLCAVEISWGSGGY